MFKRVRWMGLGAVAGVGASAWAQHRVRRTLQAHPSLQAGADVVATARRVGREVKGAVADGREAMAAREAALRAEIGADRDPADPALPQAGTGRAGTGWAGTGRSGTGWAGAAGAAGARAEDVGPGRVGARSVRAARQRYGPGRPRLRVVDATSSDGPLGASTDVRPTNLDQPR